ncbi:MAG: S41 family peptidase [Bacteroidota bacterium]
MKSIVLLLLLFLSLHQVDGQLLSPSDMQEDFTIFKESVKEIHPGLYWYADAAEIDSRFQKIEKQITNELEIGSFYGLLQKFYAEIRCGHSWMSMPYRWVKKLDRGPHTIPAGFYLEKDRIVVFRDLTKEEKLPIGDEVISINGISSKRLLDTLKQYTPTDGYAETRQIRILASNFSRYYQLHYGVDSVFEITLENGASRKSISLKGATRKEVDSIANARYPRSSQQQKLLNFSILPNDIGYLKLNSFSKSEIKEGKQRFKKFLKESFNALEGGKVNKLILDLRGNGGGEDHYGALVCKYLLQEPFRYYLRMEATTRKFNYKQYSYNKGYNIIGKLLKKDKEAEGFYTYNFSRQLKTQKPFKNNFTGKVVVLIDGGTFSAATECTSILHANQRALFIGDETGGGYFGNNSALMYGIRLPNSKISYYLPVIRYFVAVEDETLVGRGLIPDISLPRTYEHFISAEDEVLELAKTSFSK